MDMFYQDGDDEHMQAGLMQSSSSQSESGAAHAQSSASAESYEERAKSLIHNEQQFLKHLNLLVHVFRRAFEQALPPKSKVLDDAFVIDFSAYTSIT